MVNKKLVFHFYFFNKDFSLKVREGRLRPDLLRSHLTVHISLTIYDKLMYDIPKNG